MKKLPIAVVTGTALVAMSFSGCETPGQSAGLGALTGAVVGGAARNNVRGAAVGAGIGALAGAVLGKVAQDQRSAAYAQGRADAVGYPDESCRMARPSRYYGYVISPYRPYALVDVRGIRRGARVMDPVSDRVFINP
jgi:surface antigen